MSVRFGEDGSRPPHIPCFYAAFDIPRFQALCHTLGTRKGTTQAASALDPHSSGEKTTRKLRMTLGKPRALWQLLVREGFLEEVLLGLLWEEG